MKAALETKGEAGLPLVKVNGEVKSSGVYPSRDELAAWAGVGARRARSDRPSAATSRAAAAARVEDAMLRPEEVRLLLKGTVMSTLIQNPTRILFFTGKGGVGKTSAACATAIGLADAGKRVLLVSTDPASNLDEVLGVKLSATPTPVPSVPGLSALNIDPEQAAHDYRERVVGPYRGVLPGGRGREHGGAALRRLHRRDRRVRRVLEAARRARPPPPRSTTSSSTRRPTGHTLRLLELPAAWSSFIDTNVGGTSCLGPLSGLNAQKALYAASNEALRDPAQTTLVLVARPERSSLTEAERTRAELAQLGVANVRLILNGVFQARDASDATAVAMEARGRASLEALPAGLRGLGASRRSAASLRARRASTRSAGWARRRAARGERGAARRRERTSTASASTRSSTSSRSAARAS